MRSFINTAAIAIAIATTSLVSAAPTSSKSGVVQLPLGDGFPKPSANQLKQIENGAFGQLSNLPPPPSLQHDTVTSVELVALNEIIESFFFANFYKELDNPRFMSTLHELDVTEEQLRKGIESILQVEEIHAINANNALEKVVKTNPIVPCEFKFPVSDVKSAVILANRFTDVVTGTLQDVIVKAAKAGDAGFTPGVASASQDEGEQNGGFRTWLHQRAQSQPFLTAGSRHFAYSLLQDFIVPGTCKHNKNKIDLQVLQPLTADDPSAKSQDLTFKFSEQAVRSDNFNAPSKANSFIAKPKHTTSECPGLFVTYINGLTITSEPVKHCQFGKTSEVTAYLPQEEFDMFGLVIAVITNGKNFNSVDEVIAANAFGFAPLEVQEGNQF